MRCILVVDEMWPSVDETIHQFVLVQYNPWQFQAAGLSISIYAYCALYRLYSYHYHHHRQGGTVHSIALEYKPPTQNKQLI
jgi:hypothetical protein